MKSKLVFGNMINYIRKQKGLSMEDFGNLVDKNKSTISRWINGSRFPSIEEAEMIADKFGIPLDVLLFGARNVEDLFDIYIKLVESRQIEVYNFAEQKLEEQQQMEVYHDDYVGQTAAGEPIEGQQPVPIIGAESVKLLVNGDSMEDLFHDGDIVEYHPQPELENGEIGVFAVNGGVTMKRFKCNDDIRLESLNDKYEDLVIKETDDFTILGKVISREEEM